MSGFRLNNVGFRFIVSQQEDRLTRPGLKRAVGRDKHRTAVVKVSAALDIGAVNYSISQIFLFCNIIF